MTDRGALRPGRRPRRRHRRFRAPAPGRLLIGRALTNPGGEDAKAEHLPGFVSGEDRLGLAADSLDLDPGALELLVGHHRRALEGQVSVDLDPGATAVVVVLDPDRDR